jgi:hypothetical protein
MDGVVRMTVVVPLLPTLVLPPLMVVVLLWK